MCFEYEKPSLRTVKYFVAFLIAHQPVSMVQTQDPNGAGTGGSQNPSGSELTGAHHQPMRFCVLDAKKKTNLDDRSMCVCCVSHSRSGHTLGT